MNRLAVGFGTFGGAVFSIFPSFVLGDIFKTILLAAVGAIVSFFVSLVLGTLFKKRN